MPIMVERLPDEPIVVATFVEPVNFSDDAKNMFQQFIEQRDTIEGFDRYYTIIDTNGVKAGFSDIVTMLGESRIARQQRRDDMPVSLVLIGAGGLLEMAAKAIGQDQYGGYRMRMFQSQDEALSVIREEIAGG